VVSVVMSSVPAAGGGGADSVARAGDEVVVGEPDGLHEGVDDGGSHEAEPAPDHVLADGLGLGRLHRDLAAVLVARRQRFVVHERPHVLVQRTEATTHLQIQTSRHIFILPSHPRVCMLQLYYSTDFLVLVALGS
jgi:hypothetical protein